jgi:hypothetical protein
LNYPSRLLWTQRGTKCRWHSHPGRGGALIRDFADVALNLGDIDDTNVRFGGEVAIIEHHRCRSVVVGGAKNIGAAHACDIPTSRGHLRSRLSRYRRNGRRLSRRSGQRGRRRGHRRWWRRLLAAGRNQKAREGRQKLFHESLPFSISAVWLPSVASSLGACGAAADGTGSSPHRGADGRTTSGVAADDTDDRTSCCTPSRTSHRPRRHGITRRRRVISGRRVLRLRRPSCENPARSGSAGNFRPKNCRSKGVCAECATD